MVTSLRLGSLAGRARLESLRTPTLLRARPSPSVDQPRTPPSRCRLRDAQVPVPNGYTPRRLGLRAKPPVHSIRQFRPSHQRPSSSCSNGPPPRRAMVCRTNARGLPDTSLLSGWHMYGHAAGSIPSFLEQPAPASTMLAQRGDCM